MKRHTILWAICSTAPFIASIAQAQQTDIIPVIDPAVVEAAARIDKDPTMQKILSELKTPENAQKRFNSHLEITRIASPSRYELRRAEEISKRLVNDWGFAPSEIKTQADGVLPGAGLQKVDGLPVYNVCVEIKGTYSSSPDAKSYNGQYPKVIIEGHIDTVNPAVLPPQDKPYVPVKLQPLSESTVKTPAELAALKDELHFDANGRILQDENYKKAYQRFDDEQAARAGGAYRIYVPGYTDAMGNAIGVLTIAEMMKKHNIKPVYDIWVCNTAGEEGKGNLAGMKQLYGYNQDTGKGNNALNVVANFSIDGGEDAVHYTGSYRFEMKYKEPDSAAFAQGEAKPSALNAIALTISEISNVKTDWDKDNKSTKTTYTVGVVKCEKAKSEERSASCSLEVDMRSSLAEPLKEIRKVIEPLFQAGATAENKRLGIAIDSDKAIKIETVWVGDRPAHVRENLSDIAIQAAWQSAAVVGVGKRTSINTKTSSLNDNVPAAVGIPTINLNIHSKAATDGGHAFWEWGIPGNAENEALNIYRVMMTALIASGFNATDGTVIPPAAGPIGGRTTEEMYK